MPILILTPLTVEPTKAKTLPKVDLDLVLPEGFHNVPVRLFVYEQSVFVRNLGLEEARSDPSSVKDPLWKFKRPAVMTEDEMNAKVDGDNGLLLTVDTTLIRKENPDKEARERNPFVWCIRTPKITENQRPSAGAVVLHVRQDDLKVQPVANIKLPSPLAIAGTSLSDRLLLFRLALLAPTSGGVPANTIVVAGLRADTHKACLPVRVRKAAVEQMYETIRVGGDGGKQEVPEVPSATARVVTPNLSGFYEAYRVPDPARSSDPKDQEPLFMVQMNQAGKVLVGWFAWPRKEFLTQGLQDARPLQTDHPGSFWCHLDGTGRPVEWWQYAERGQNTHDPLQFERPTQDGQVHTGEIDILGDSGPQIRLRLSGMGVATPGQAPPVTEVSFFLFRIKDKPRLSNFMLDQLSARELKSIWTTNEAEPIPVFFWEQLAKKCRPGSPLTKTIDAWHRASDRASRLKPREDASDELMKIFRAIQLLPQQNVVLSRFKGDMARTLHTVDDKTDSVLGWLTEMVKDLMQTIKANPANEGKTFEQMYQLVEEGFRRFDIKPSGRFIYMIDVFAAGIGMQLVVGLGVYGFRAEITRWIKDDELGIVRLDEKWGKPVYWGGFDEVGIGIKVKAGLEGGAPGTAMPGVIEFESFHDLTPGDFDRCILTSEAIGGPKVTVGGLINLSASAAFVQCVMPSRGGLTIHTICTKFYKPGTKKKFDKVPIPSLSFDISLAEVAFATGMLYMGAPPKTDRREDEIVGGKKMREMVVRFTDVSYNVDQSTLTPNSRSELEVFLATERRVFAHLGGKLRLEGHASPEGTEKENDRLSEGRARQGLTAIKDAYGGSFSIPEDEVRVVFFGDEEALKNGLTRDPKGKVLTGGALRAMEDQRKDYPLYRRTDILLNAIPITSLVPLKL